MEGITPAKRFAAYNTESAGRAIKKTAHVNLRLTEELVSKLTEVGDSEGLSMSDTVRLVLWRGIRFGEDPQNKEHN